MQKTMAAGPYDNQFPAASTAALNGRAQHQRNHQQQQQQQQQHERNLRGELSTVAQLHDELTVVLQRLMHPHLHMLPLPSEKKCAPMAVTAARAPPPLPAKPSGDAVDLLCSSSSSSNGSAGGGESSAGAMQSERWKRYVQQRVFSQHLVVLHRSSLLARSL
jgi:hypothetical protein